MESASLSPASLSPADSGSKTMVAVTPPIAEPAAKVAIQAAASTPESEAPSESSASGDHGTGTQSSEEEEEELPEPLFEIWDENRKIQDLVKERKSNSEAEAALARDSAEILMECYRSLRDCTPGYHARFHKALSALRSTTQHLKSVNHTGRRKFYETLKASPDRGTECCQEVQETLTTTLKAIKDQRQASASSGFVFNSFKTHFRDSALAEGTFDVLKNVPGLEHGGGIVKAAGMLASKMFDMYRTSMTKRAAIEDVRQLIAELLDVIDGAQGSNPPGSEQTDQFAPIKTFLQSTKTELNNLAGYSKTKDALYGKPALQFIGKLEPKLFFCVLTTFASVTHQEVNRISHELNLSREREARAKEREECARQRMYASAEVEDRNRERRSEVMKGLPKGIEIRRKFAIGPQMCLERRTEKFRIFIATMLEESEQSDRRVCLKEPAGPADERIVESINHWNMISSEHIAPLLGIYYPPSNDTTFYIVTEYYTLGDLWRWCTKEGNQPERAKYALKLILDVARCIAHVHNSGRAYGNILPWNFLLTSDERGPRAIMGDPFRMRETRETENYNSNNGHINNMRYLESSGFPSKEEDVFAWARLAVFVLSGVEPWYRTENVGATLTRILGDHESDYLQPEIRRYKLSKAKYATTETNEDAMVFDWLAQYPQLWELLSSCWYPEVGTRPTIAQVIQQLEVLINRAAS